MASSPANTSPPAPGPATAAIPFGRLPRGLVVVIAGLGALLFLPAGRLDWPAGWALLLGYSAFLMLYGLWAWRHDPGQLAERSRTGRNVKGWDRALMAVYTVLLLALFPVAAVDAVRLRWSSPPLGLRAAAWIGLAAAGGIVLWTTTANTYLSRMVRIQDDRGQQVATGGPYRYIRHPMYLGVIILVLGVPPALGSWWGLVPGGLIAALFVVRTALEDRTLQAELAGYREYVARVRYRLLPRIW